MSQWQQYPILADNHAIDCLDIAQSFLYRTYGPEKENNGQKKRRTLSSPPLKFKK